LCSLMTFAESMDMLSYSWMRGLQERAGCLTGAHRVPAA